MKKRQELEAMIKRLKEERGKILNGCPWGEMTELLYMHSDAPAVVFPGTDKVIRNIDIRIAEAEKELASLPKMSVLDSARYAYVYIGASNSTTKAYIDALEKCRPWVIRNRQSGGLWLACIGGFVSSVSFLSKHDADEFLDKEIMQKSEWEVVQWEGEE